MRSEASRDGDTNRHRVGLRLGLGLALLLAGASAGFEVVRGGDISVPNASFESPATDFASPSMADWEKAPEPAWYQGGGGFPWAQLVGQFLNPTNGSPNYIDNMERAQAAFLFALPDVAVFQDYNSIGDTATEPTHGFNVTLESGKSYALTVAVLGGGGGMKEGATLEISLYYRDAAGSRVPLGSRTITYTAALFPTTTHFIDFEARTPVVGPNDPWAGRTLGIHLASTVGFELQGGYWDLDNVRLSFEEHPELTGFGITDGHFQFRLKGAPGEYEVLASDNPGQPLSNWIRIGTATSVTGYVVFTDPDVAVGDRFYQVRPAQVGGNL